MKTFVIHTWSGGTPTYLVSAETKERAWEIVEETWRNEMHTFYVGSDYYHCNRKQTIDDLIELPTFTNSIETIVDINSL